MLKELLRTKLDPSLLALTEDREGVERFDFTVSFSSTGKDFAVDLHVLLDSVLYTLYTKRRVLVDIELHEMHNRVSENHFVFCDLWLRQLSSPIRIGVAHPKNSEVE